MMEDIVISPKCEKGKLNAALQYGARTEAHISPFFKTGWSMTVWWLHQPWRNRL